MTASLRPGCSQLRRRLRWSLEDGGNVKVWRTPQPTPSRTTLIAGRRYLAGEGGRGKTVETVWGEVSRVVDTSWNRVLLRLEEAAGMLVGQCPRYHLAPRLLLVGPSARYHLAPRLLRLKRVLDTGSFALR